MLASSSEAPLAFSISVISCECDRGSNQQSIGRNTQIAADNQRGRRRIDELGIIQKHVLGELHFVLRCPNDNHLVRLRVHRRRGSLYVTTGTHSNLSQSQNLFQFVDGNLLVQILPDTSTLQRQPLHSFKGINSRHIVVNNEERAFRRSDDRLFLADYASFSRKDAGNMCLDLRTIEGKRS